MRTPITMILLAVLLTLSLCKAYHIYPTPTAHNGAASTTMPEPTSPATTSGVRFVNKDVLFPRQGASSLGTCAYEKGDPTSPLTCEAGDVCTWETGSATSTFWGPNCCPSTASDCSAYALTSCIDYESHDLQDNNATVISRELYW